MNIFKSKGIAKYNSEMEYAEELGKRKLAKYEKRYIRQYSRNKLKAQLRNQLKNDIEDVFV